MQRQPWFYSVLGLFALLLSSTNVLAQRSIESGHWAIVGEEGLGSGINVNIQNGQIALTIFTYDTEGDATWYLATGQFQDGSSLLRARLLGARDGRSLEQPFDPAEFVDTGRDISITFTGTTTGEFTLDGVTKPIQLLRFAGETIEIPGGADPGFVDQIPDVTGEWMFVSRREGFATQTRVMHLRRMLTFPQVGIEIPDAPIIYFDQSNPLAPIYFYCDVQQFDGISRNIPSCFLRFIESERITEFEVPTENISQQRFEIGFIGIPGTVLPEVFALRLGDLDEQ